SFYPIVGGMETQVQRLIPYLRAEGVDAWVLTRRTPGTVAFERHNGIDIHRARIVGGPGLRSISFTLGGAATILRQRERTDLIHAHAIMSPTTVAVLAGGALRVPKVVTLHAAYEIDHLLRKPLGGTRLRAYPRIVDRFISISNDITSLLTGHGVSPTRVVEIPNGIDTTAYAP